MECEKLFCKTNIKLKVLKLNKTKFISKRRHKIEKIVRIGCFDYLVVILNFNCHFEELHENKFFELFNTARINSY